MRSILLFFLFSSFRFAWTQEKATPALPPKSIYNESSASSVSSSTSSRSSELPRSSSSSSVAASSSSSPPLLARAVDPASGDLKVSHINSCSTIDRIPWGRVKTGGKRTRQIFRDLLKLDSEKIFSTWELHQVLSSNGEVSFVFLRERKDGKEEFIAAKGSVTARVMEVSKGKRRLIGQEDMGPLINRTSMSLTHKDGSRVEFIPGQTNKSTVVIYPTNDIGVSLAPVYLKGISCDKPESFNDADINSKDLGQAGKEGSPKANQSSGQDKK